MLYCNRHNRPILISLSAAVLAVVVSVSGCGKRGHELAPVNGKVTYRGKPLPFGNVMFQPEQGQPATGNIQPDGTFQMTTAGEGDGAAVGKNQVRVACFETQDPRRAAGHGEIAMGKSMIPQKYTSYETSGITVDVRPGANEPLILSLTD